MSGYLLKHYLCENYIKILFYLKTFLAEQKLVITKKHIPPGKYQQSYYKLYLRKGCFLIRNQYLKYNQYKHSF